MVLVAHRVAKRSVTTNQAVVNIKRRVADQQALSGGAFHPVVDQNNTGGGGQCFGVVFGMVAVGEVTGDHLVNFVDAGNQQGRVADDFKAEFSGQTGQVQGIAQLHDGRGFESKDKSGPERTFGGFDPFYFPPNRSRPSPNRPTSTEPTNPHRNHYPTHGFNHHTHHAPAFNSSCPSGQNGSLRRL